MKIKFGCNKLIIGEGKGEEEDSNGWVAGRHGNLDLVKKWSDRFQTLSNYSPSSDV